MMKRKSVGIVLFENVEVLDFCGPFEVFSVTRLEEAKRNEEPSPFEVKLIAENKEAIQTTGAMRVLPDDTFENCPQLDILIVPGGWGTRQEINNSKLLHWLQQMAPQVETLASVCTGAMLLGQAGLLHNLHATTHWRSLDWMQDTFPSIKVEKDQRIVQQGNIWTSAGISAGIDMALKIVAHYYGETIAKATAKYMEYPYPKDNRR